MRKLFLPALFMIATSCHAQSDLTDMKVLIGRKAVAQRMPFYQPGTYTAIPLSYAGQQVTIIDVKPQSLIAGFPKLTPKQLAFLPPQSREMVENAQRAATLIVQFPDGTKADTGASPVMPSALSSYLDLLPEEQSSSSSVVTANPLVTAPANVVSNEPLATQTCPVVVTKAASTSGGFGHALLEAMTKSEFQRAMEKAGNGGADPHYLDVRMRNTSAKPVRAIEAFAVYSDAMGDEGPRSTILSQNDKPIKSGGEYFGYEYDTSTRQSNGIGDVTVYVNRVRYEDNTFWLDNGSHSCSLTTRIK